MLSQARVAAMIAVNDMNRARRFYEGTLGLSQGQQTGDTVMYHCGGGTVFAIYPSSFAGTAQNTVMAWQTQDLDGLVADLRGRGVVFEEYDMPGLKTVNGIASLEGTRVAWFKDPDGNTLAVEEIG